MMNKTSALAVVLGTAVIGAVPVVEPAASAQKCCYRQVTKLFSRGLDLQRGTLHVERGSGWEHLAYFFTDPRAPREARGEPILLLHGFTAEKESWLRMMRPLRENHRVVALDLAGHGASSDASDDDYGLLRQAQRARALAVELGLGRYHVLGHSMGGGVAVALTLEYPDEVLSLGLIAPAAKERPHTEEFCDHLRGESEDKPGLEINPLIIGEDWSHSERVRYVTHGPRWLHLGSHLHSCVSQASPERTETTYPKIFEQLAPKPCSPERASRPPFSDEELWRINQPTFIRWGTEDRVLEPSLDFYEDHLGGEVDPDDLPGVGHTPIIEAPGKVAKAYLAFLEGLALP
jgi:pimeloyl-ACP methyl ester carboxylesterase